MKIIVFLKIRKQLRNLMIFFSIPAINLDESETYITDVTDLNDPILRP